MQGERIPTQMLRMLHHQTNCLRQVLLNRSFDNRLQYFQHANFKIPGFLVAKSRKTFEIKLPSCKTKKRKVHTNKPVFLGRFICGESAKHSATFRTVPRSRHSGGVTSRSRAFLAGLRVPLPLAEGTCSFTDSTRFDALSRSTDLAANSRLRSFRANAWKYFYVPFNTTKLKR